MIWKGKNKEDMAYFKIQSQQVTRETEEKHENTQSQ